MTRTIIELLILLAAGYFTTGVAIATFERREILPKGGSRILWFIGLVAAAICVNNTMATIVLGLFLIFTVILLLFMMEEPKEKMLAVGLGKILGIPGTLGVVANVIISIATSGFGKGNQLYWLIAPAFYYLVLTIASHELSISKEPKKKKGKKEERNYEFVLPLALTMVFVAAIVVTLVFAKNKGVI